MLSLTEMFVVQYNMEQIHFTPEGGQPQALDNLGQLFELIIQPDEQVESKGYYKIQFDTCFDEGSMSFASVNILNVKFAKNEENNLQEFLHYFCDFLHEQRKIQAEETGSTVQQAKPMVSARPVAKSPMASKQRQFGLQSNFKKNKNQIGFESKGAKNQIDSKTKNAQEDKNNEIQRQFAIQLKYMKLNYPLQQMFSKNDQSSSSIQYLLVNSGATDAQNSLLIQENAQLKQAILKIEQLKLSSSKTDKTAYMKA